MSEFQIVEGIAFLCNSNFDKYRADTLLTKEPGTVAWIKQHAKEGEVLYDVGANVGCYTLLAASLGAEVFAFEPHIPNAHTLIQNVIQNKLTDKVKVITCPLSNEGRWFPFHYHSLKSGSSGSQLGHVDEKFVAQLVEIKRAVTIDSLRWVTGFKPPTLIKIDVDGNEPEILRGAEALLRREPPKSLQVEIHPTTHDMIVDYLRGFGYTESYRHDTSNGQILINSGINPKLVPHNQVFRKP